MRMHAALKFKLYGTLRKKAALAEKEQTSANIPGTDEPKRPVEPIPSSERKVRPFSIEILDTGISSAHLKTLGNKLQVYE